MAPSVKKQRIAKICRDDCIKLIQLYESHKLLWDPNNTHYYDRGLKEITWNIIHRDMQPTSHSVEDLKNKMVSLQGCYRREKSRERKSQIGSGRDDVYKSNWYAFPYFQFMKDKNELGETPELTEDDSEGANETKFEVVIPKCEPPEDPLDQIEATTDEIYENILIDEKVLLESKKNAKLGKRKNKTNEDDDSVTETWKLLKQCGESSDGDACNIYGQYIANELRKYDPITLAYVKRAINNIIFDADIGKYRKC
nr:uncharacterized protein LOC111419064 [Onthophagus taurus]